MPWATLGPFSITGSTIKDGKVLMAVALGALALSLAPRRRVVRLLDVVLALSAFLASFIDTGNASGLASKASLVLPVKVGSGLIVCVCASGAWLATLLWEQWSLIRARRRSRFMPPARLQPAA
jgi:hypothetical protein